MGCILPAIYEWMGWVNNSYDTITGNELNSMTDLATGGEERTKHAIFSVKCLIILKGGLLIEDSVGTPVKQHS